MDLLGAQLRHPAKHGQDKGDLATFRSVAVETLINRMPDDDSRRAYACFLLASKIQLHDEVELDEPARASIVKRVAAARIGASPLYNNLVIGRMQDILEGKNPDAMAAVEAEVRN